MPDPIFEGAEYVLLARRGETGLFLVQQGRMQDPGTVAVIDARPSSGASAVARWLTRAVTTWLAAFGGGGGMALHHVATATRPGSAAALQKPTKAQRERRVPVTPASWGGDLKLKRPGSRDCPSEAA
jgi:hypothetical protein